MDRFMAKLAVEQPPDLVSSGRPRTKITLADGTPTSLRQVLTRLAKHVIPATWHFIRTNSLKPIDLSNAQAFALVLEFICCKEQTQAQIYAEFSRMKGINGTLSVDMPKKSRRFMIKYGQRAVEFIFGQPYIQIITSIRQGHSLAQIISQSSK